MGLVEGASDPLDHVVDRAADRFDVDDVDGARRAADGVLDVLARLPVGRASGLDLKAAKALDRLAQRLRLPVDALRRDLAGRRRTSRGNARPVSFKDRRADPGTQGPSEPKVEPPRTIRPDELDPLDRELVEIILHQPEVVGRLITIVAVGSLRDAPLRAILQACYDLHGEGVVPAFSEVASRLDDPALRTLLATLVTPINDRPMSEKYRIGRYLPPPWLDRLGELLPRLLDRSHGDRLRDLEGALAEVDAQAEPEQRLELWREKMRLIHERKRLIATKKSSDAS